MKELLHTFFWSFAHDRLHRLDAWLMKKIGQTPGNSAGKEVATLPS